MGCFLYDTVLGFHNLRAQNYGNYFCWQSFYFNILLFVKSQVFDFFADFGRFLGIFHSKMVFFTCFRPYLGVHLTKPKAMKNFTPGKLIYYFFQGLIILAPIVITAWAVVSLFNFVDGILPNLLRTLFPNLVKMDAQGNPQEIPGLGFLTVIIIVFLVGYLSSNFFVSKMVQLFDGILERTPGIKLIYTTVKDFLEAFAGNKRKFNKPVLVSVDDKEVWRIGFITQTDLEEFGLREYYSVYVPHSYAFSGITYLVQKDRIKNLDDVKSAEAMKFVLSGGVTDLGEGGD